MANPLLLTVETHCHTKYSQDCLMEPARMVDICRARGIDRLCITDHNTARGALEMAARWPELIIPGEEILTTRGELLAYFIRAEVPAGLSPLETIARLRAQEAVISVSHPYEVQRHGWTEPELRALLPHVDAIEVFNARCLTSAPNDRALALAHETGILGTVGSDAHSYRELGRATLQLPPFDGAEAFRQALQKARFNTRLSSPLIHLTSRWAVLVKRIRG